MNGIRGTNPAGRQCNRILDLVVTIIKYKKISIGREIYINLFTDCNISYITVSTDYVLDTTNKVKDFSELRKVIEEAFNIKIKNCSLNI